MLSVKFMFSYSHSCSLVTRNAMQLYKVQGFLYKSEQCVF